LPDDADQTHKLDEEPVGRSYDAQEMMFEKIESGEAVFRLREQGTDAAPQPKASDGVCEVCDRRTVVTECECCDKEVKVCGARCLLRHAEGRYEVQRPDESSETFDRISKLQEGVPVEKEEGDRDTPPPEQSLVLISAFDGIGGAMRALELLDLKPATYVSIETDPECKKVVEKAWPDVISLGCLEDLDPRELGELLRKDR
jgi:hypothetical protein